MYWSKYAPIYYLPLSLVGEKAWLIDQFVIGPGLLDIPVYQD